MTPEEKQELDKQINAIGKILYNQNICAIAQRVAQIFVCERFTTQLRHRLRRRLGRLCLPFQVCQRQTLLLRSARLGRICVRGAVESTVKQIDRRLKISGAQWKIKNLPQVLRHRCACLNNSLLAS